MDKLTEINERLKEINTLIENDEGTDELKEEKETLEAKKAELSGDDSGKGDKLFTQEELDAVVEKRIAREKVKQEELKKQAEREKKQAEELAKLSAEERTKKEFEIEQENFKRQQQEFYRERLELQTTKELDERDLPVSFAKYVIGEDAETTQERINEFEGLWEKELERRRVDAMRGTTPAKGEQPGFKNPFSKEHLNLTEQGRLIREEPEKAKALQKQAKK